MLSVGIRNLLVLVCVAIALLLFLVVFGEVWVGKDEPIKALAGAGVAVVLAVIFLIVPPAP